VTIYRVEFLSKAADDLERLDNEIIERILSKLKWVADNCSGIAPEPLTGKLKGLFKLRVGNYRILYSLDRDQRIITAHLVGHRREIYRI